MAKQIVRDMTTLEVKCPNCSSTENEKETADWYLCKYCGNRFRPISPYEKTIFRDVVAHNCPICGKPVDVRQGYRCVKCGRTFVCSICVGNIGSSMVPRFACLDCIKKANMDCVECGRVASYHCGACENRVCFRHYDKFFEQNRDVSEIPFDDAKERRSWFNYTCSECGRICKNCVEVRSRFLGLLKVPYCKNCGSKLQRNELVF